MAGLQLIDAHIPSPHPQISPAILPYRLPFTFRKSVLPSQHCSSAAVHAADLPAASVPHNLPIHQNAVRSWTGAAFNPGNQALGKSLASGFGREFHKAGIRAQICVSLAVSLYALKNADCFEGGG